MKRHRKVSSTGASGICLILVLLLCLTCTGCMSVTIGILDGLGLWKPTKDEDDSHYNYRIEALSGRAYENAMDTFFTALDNGDAAAARSVFSPEALAADTQLDETLEQLLAIYTGPVEINERFGAGSSSSDISYGQRRMIEENSRFIRAGGEDYWCFFEMTVLDDWNPDAVGVTCVRFYTIDAFCNLQADLWEREEDDNLGLSFYAGPEVDGEIRIVEMKPLIWTETATLDTQEVLAFLEEGGPVAYDDFVARFGPPAAVWQGWKAYYALPSENGQPRYLDLAVNEATHHVEVVRIMSELEWIETIWSISGGDDEE